MRLSLEYSKPHFADGFYDLIMVPLFFFYGGSDGCYDFGRYASRIDSKLYIYKIEAAGTSRDAIDRDPFWTGNAGIYIYQPDSSTLYHHVSSYNDCRSGGAPPVF